MSADPKFLAASEAARGWLNTVFGAIRYGKEGNVGLAYMHLRPPAAGRMYNLFDSFNEHAAMLFQMLPALEVLSDGAIEMPHGWGRSGISRGKNGVYPHVWSSAHQAAFGIAELALDLLVVPLLDIDDSAERQRTAKQLLKHNCKALALSEAQVARWQERIKRERAKLLSASGNATAARPTKTLPTIWHHSGQSYSKDGRKPVNVSNEMHNVLKKFLDRDEAFDTRTLSNSGASNVAAVISKIGKLFGTKAIQRPDRKGAGYFIRVRSKSKLASG